MVKTSNIIDLYPDKNIDQTLEFEAHLSEREKECLTWASLGKTNCEIATILSIKTYTVGSYLKSASKKLHTRSKIHTIVRAVQLKLIFPY